MTARTRIAVAALGVTAALLAGCGTGSTTASGPGTGGPSVTTPAVATTPSRPSTTSADETTTEETETRSPTSYVGSETTTRWAAGRPVRLTTSGTCSVSGDLEGQFTSSSQMDDYLVCVLPQIEAWIDDTYTNMPSPDGYYFVPLGVSGGSSQCPYTDEALQYCPDSQRVYLGELAIWDQYRNFGDAAPVTVVAHEVTHHFQRVARMRPATVPNEQIRYEDQADCGAGAFIRYADNLNVLDRQDDLRDLAGSLAAAGETESVKQTHGTMQERLYAFEVGYGSSAAHPLSACSVYVPETPLVT